MLFLLFLWAGVVQHLKMINLKRKTITTIFNPKVKTNGFLIVFIDRGWSTFKDEKLEEKNYDDDFQSEGKNQRFFNGYVMTMNLDDFITKWSFSIRREIPMVF